MQQINVGLWKKKLEAGQRKRGREERSGPGSVYTWWRLKIL